VHIVYKTEQVSFLAFRMCRVPYQIAVQ